MTEPSDARETALTDRERLAGSAYRSGRDLAARQALHRLRTPRYDLPGLAAERLAGVRGSLVDVGCGNGTFVRRIRAERPDLTVLGLDLSPGILADVPGPVAVADAGRLPLASESAGAALAMHMLYHVPDIPGAVAELARVVRRDGPVLVSTNGERDKAELDELWQRAAADVLGTGRGPDRLVFSDRFTLERAPALLRAEFRQVETLALPGVVTVHDPAPIVAYLTSYRAWADQYESPFEATVERARTIVADHIARIGSFRVTCRAGLLVCRR